MTMEKATVNAADTNKYEVSSRVCIRLNSG